MPLSAEARKVLECSIERIEQPERWAKYRSAYDEGGNTTSSLSRDAYSFCVTGAIHRCAAELISPLLREMDDISMLKVRAIEADVLKALAPHAWPVNGWLNETKLNPADEGHCAVAIVAFNDREATSHSDVMQLLRKGLDDA